MDEPQAPLTVLLQDEAEGRALSKALASKPDARQRVREACAIIEAHRRSDSLLTAHELGVLEAALSTAPVQGALTDEQIRTIVATVIRDRRMFVNLSRELTPIEIGQVREIAVAADREVARAALASAPHPTPSNTLGDALTGPGDPVASLPTPPIAAGDVRSGE